MDATESARGAAAACRSSRGAAAPPAGPAATRFYAQVKGVLSSQRNPPSACVGMEGIKDAGRPIEKQLNSADTMGPKYSLDNITYGIQVQSRIKSAPRATFGSGPQRYHGMAGGKTRAAEPSPQHYDSDKMTQGILKLSTRRSVPGMKFMTGPRTYNDADAREGASKPAPGQYNSQSSMGRQIESQYKAGGSFSIVGGRRDFVKNGAGKEPGPGHYVDPINEGRNEKGEVKAVLSSQKSYPSAVFGTSKQRPSSEAGGSKLEKRPGAKYKVQGSMGKMVDSRYRSQPIVSFGAR